MLRLFKKTRTTQQHVLCFSIVDQELLALSVQQQAEGVWAFQSSLALSHPSSESTQRAFKSWVKANSLEGASVSAVLIAHQYRSFLLDAPAVPEAELSKAARWLVKDLIKTPMAEVLVDALPLEVRQGQAPKMQVVSTDRQVLAPFFELANFAGIELAEVNVLDSALAGLLVRDASVDAVTAILFLHPKQQTLVLVESRRVLMIRELQLAKAEQAVPLFLEADIALELLRSFDFYQAHFAKRMPTRLAVLGNVSVDHALCERLATLLKLSLMELPTDLIFSNLPKGLSYSLLPLLGQAAWLTLEGAP